LKTSKIKVISLYVKKLYKEYSVIKKKSETISQEEFITIFDMIEKYHSLIHKYKKSNSKFEKAQEYIEKNII